MTARDIGMPSAGEYPAYAALYIVQVPSPFTIDSLLTSFDEAEELLRSLPGADLARLRTAPGKWNVAEIIGHISDCERILAYRMLCVARGDETPLPGFDQDAYAAAAPHATWSLDELLADWRTVRASTVSLLRGFPDEAWLRAGTASGNPITVRALAAFILGHERHHMRILRQRFVAAA
jgi:hypothetical protein